MEFFFAASRSVEQGRPTHAVLEAGTAIELLVNAIIRGVASAENWAPAELEKVLEKYSFRDRFDQKFAPALDQAVDRDEGTDPLSRWWADGYLLRNKVAHAGYRPTDDEVKRAVAAAGALIDFAATRANEDQRLGITVPRLGNASASEGFEDSTAADELRAPTTLPSSRVRVIGAAFLEGHDKLRDGDEAGALDAFTRAAAAGSLSAQFNVGVTHLRRGHLSDAQAAFARASEAGHPTASFNFGTLLAAQGKSAEAKAAYEQAISSMHPVAAPGAGYNLGNLLLDEEDLEGAEAAYRQASVHDGSDAAQCAAFMRARLLQAQDKLAEAIPAYQRAVELGNARAAVNLATLLALDDRFEEAETALRRARELDDEDVGREAAFNLGLLLSERRPDDAEAAFEEAAARGEPQSRFLLALACHEREDDAGARAHLDAARATEVPDIVAAADRLAGQLGLNGDA
jgi:tetratricopeptide (TPR) repeat protein